MDIDFVVDIVLINKFCPLDAAHFIQQNSNEVLLIILLIIKDVGQKQFITVLFLCLSLFVL